MDENEYIMVIYSIFSHNFIDSTYRELNYTIVYVWYLFVIVSVSEQK